MTEQYHTQFSVGEAAKKRNVPKKNGKSPKGGGAVTKIKKTTIYNVDYFQMRGEGVQIF